MIKEHNGIRVGDLVTFGSGKPRAKVVSFSTLELEGLTAELRLTEVLVGTCGGFVPAGEVIPVPARELRLIG